MARIDITKITGYSDMSPEDKVKALESLSIPDEIDMSKYISKEKYDKLSHEIATLKDKMKEQLSDEEKKKAEEQERFAELEQKYADLLKVNTIAETKAKFLGMGYDEALAEDTAKAMVDGKMDVVFANQKKHMDAFEQKIRTDALKGTPRPNGGGDPNGDVMTLEKLRKLPLADRMKFATEHPEDYTRLYGGTQ